MKLSGEQRKKLQEALINAFPTKSSLEQMLSFGLDKNLDSIAGGSDLQEIVFKLIKIAESQEWVLDLVGAALKSNSENVSLQTSAQELLPPSPLPNVTKRESTQLSQFQDKYYEWLINKCQNYRTEGLSQLGSLLLSDVFVPLKVAANYVDKVRPEMIPLVNYHSNSLKVKTIWDFLLAVTSDTPILTWRCIVVLGAPGSGKSTLLKHIAYIYANKKQKELHEDAPKLIPVLLLIRELHQEIVDKQPPLADFIAEQVKLEIEENQTPQSASKWFAEKLKENKCLIMLDGLDEVADETQRHKVRDWIDKQIKSFSQNIFILTSRPRGYKEASLKNVGIVLEVQPLKLEQVRDFIHKWYLATEKIRLVGDSISEIEEQAKQQAEDVINRIRNSSPLAAMAVNPLLLTMISMVHHKLSLENRSLPEKRVELYKEMCEVLLEKRQLEKNITDNLTGKNKQSVLQVMALELMQHEDTEFKLADGTSWIQEQLATVVSNEVKPENFIEYICEISGLLVEKELNYYQFPHLSFQEYLAAVQVSELNQEELLISKINESWWAETIRLYAAQSDATRLIRAVLDMQYPSVNVMALAYDCLEESLRVDENIQHKLVRTLEEGLESTDSERFKLAAQVRLIRRLKKTNWFRIDKEVEDFGKEVEIDNSYITCSEYQLFLDETRKFAQPQDWQNGRFPAGYAKKIITGISRENALKFCAWLGEWYRKRIGNQLSELATHYRLAIEDEREQHPIKDDKEFSESGICLVKFQLPSKYNQLADYLWNGEWQKADEETVSVMLQVIGSDSEGYLHEQDKKNFPCEDLRNIDQLWVYASKGYFGFSVQKDIYQSLGGTQIYNHEIWNAFLNRVGWQKEGIVSYVSSDFTFGLDASRGHLPVLKNSYPGILMSYELIVRAETCRL
ncbi:hypothetical protein NIES4073_31580 [Kalymmatonema gypsitolerans NIES-4073]|nr:hypothetical protein NIES4073_31580 [Scytonema sp. NIES-4073]